MHGFRWCGIVFYRGCTISGGAAHQRLSTLRSLNITTTPFITTSITNGKKIFIITNPTKYTVLNFFFLDGSLHPFLFPEPSEPTLIGFQRCMHIAHLDALQTCSGLDNALARQRVMPFFKLHHPLSLLTCGCTQLPCKCGFSMGLFLLLQGLSLHERTALDE